MDHNDNVWNEYFEWMFNLVCGKRFSEYISFRELLIHLHNTEFIFIIPRDVNRAKDGADLRRRFALIHGYDDVYLDMPCSVLEMMIALSIRCEESIMDDPYIGDRTGQWFWGMINNLGLGGMSDDRFDRRYVDGVIDRFLRRIYEPNGRGGLFTIRNTDRDIRDLEIWVQMCWYLDSIV